MDNTEYRLRFGISERKAAQLVSRMAALDLREEDLVERFVRSQGPGGQKVNKTSTAVYLKHLPSGREVKAQSSRSQAHNRYEARKLLVELVEEEQLGALSRERQRIEKLRRQKRKRSKRAKEKVLAAKRHQSEKKERRRPPRDD